MYDNYNNGYEAPKGGGIPNSDRDMNVNNSGAKNGSGILNNAGVPNGYGVSNGTGMSNGYVAPNGYSINSNYSAPNSYGVPNSYGMQNNYGAPNSYGIPNNYGAPNSCGTPISYGMPVNFGMPMMSKEQFFGQPQYKGKRGAIIFGAVSMYLAALAELFIAASAENFVYILFMIFSIVMGIVIQVSKNSVCAIISSVFYGFWLMIYVVLDIIFLFAGTMAIFDLVSSDAVLEYGIMMVILVILEVFLAFLPMSGSIAASVAIVKMDNEWAKYKMSFYRRGFY